MAAYYRLEVQRILIECTHARCANKSCTCGDTIYVLHREPRPTGWQSSRSTLLSNLACSRLSGVLDLQEKYTHIKQCPYCSTDFASRSPWSHSFSLDYRPEGRRMQIAKKLWKSRHAQSDAYNRFQDPCASQVSKKMVFPAPAKHATLHYTLLCCEKKTNSVIDY